jgi:hypothetical protein
VESGFYPNPGIAAGLRPTADNQSACHMHAPSFNGGDLVSTTDHWYAAGLGGCVSNTTVALVANRITQAPQYFERSVKIDKIGIDVTTTNAGSCRIGIFEPSFKDFNYGGRCIGATDSFNTGSSGVQTLPLVINLIGGRVYFFVLYDISGTANLRAAANTSMTPGVGKDTPNSNSLEYMWRPTSTLAAFPNILPSGGTKHGSASNPIVYYHVAA